MRKIQVIMQKELVDPMLIRHCTAVVIDVFLATSTMVSLLENQYKRVYAVKDANAALVHEKDPNIFYRFMGEWKGEPIENFDYPDPTCVKKIDDEQAAIICSTNGTIAIDKSKSAKKLYVSSLVNGHRVAERIQQQEDGASIVLVCSGNAGRFSMEDFVGAGQIIDHLVRAGNYHLSDAATFARDSFLHSKSMNFTNLLEGETAQLLQRTGHGHTSQWVIDQFEKINAVPVFIGDSFISLNQKEVILNRKVDEK